MNNPVCQICNKVFRTESGLRWHMENSHSQSSSISSSPESGGTSPGVSDSLSEVIATWQNQLLQLDRRNNLLYFRPGKTAVRIVEHSPDSLIEQLLSSRKGLSFDYAEARGKRTSATINDSVQSASELDSQPVVTKGDLRGDCSVLDLHRKLGNLRRRDREWEQEQGLNVLFLTLGVLKWEDEEGEPAASPLLLLPCNLERNSPHDPFMLVPEEDDTTVNQTLQVKLSEFGIELPQLEQHDPGVADYLNHVEASVEKREWTVEQEVWLATFAYSKLAMWRDLEKMREGHDIRLSMLSVEIGL